MLWGAIGAQETHDALLGEPLLVEGHNAFQYRVPWKDDEQSQVDDELIYARHHDQQQQVDEHDVIHR